MSDGNRSFPETVARAIFQQAINEQRCAELLECLFEDGTATVDAKTGNLVVIPAEAMKPLAAENDG